ncbi:hypothetical protein FRC18_010717 [Serendipita sp. 400]|nr:hypothetical protein FRC18_010717 [Serendipita sp. 400]
MVIDCLNRTIATTTTTTTASASDDDREEGEEEEAIVIGGSGNGDGFTLGRLALCLRNKTYRPFSAILVSNSLLLAWLTWRRQGEVRQRGRESTRQGQGQGVLKAVGLQQAQFNGIYNAM